MLESRLDHIYRSLLLTRFFTRGWGDPETLKKIIRFRKILGDRTKAQAYLDNSQPVTLTREVVKDGVRVIDGHFPTPLLNHLPEVCPKEIGMANFQAVIPSDWPTGGPQPVVLQFAGTGDHYFWRRRNMMALPLAREHKVGSIILENPYYGVRKPKNQLRSSLHYVSDLFVMGACLMMESQVLLHWAERQKWGPLCCHGISMGGHMASLAAATWPRPIALVPCLSWTSGSVTFCQGVMSRAIDWKQLSQQFNEGRAYKTEVLDLLVSPEFGETNNYFKEEREKEALHFMRWLMDECTHLGNFSPPVDPDLVELVVAEYDAYQPRVGITPLHQVWGGCREPRIIKEGHIKSYILHSHVFRTAICDALERMSRKYQNRIAC